jgi:phosphoglycerate dehydrogenase-like enzyme
MSSARIDRMAKPVIILDPHFRRMDEIFRPEDLDRLRAVAEVAWGQDPPMPAEEFHQILPNAVAVVTGGWRRYGIEALGQARRLKAILDVGGGFPGAELDYDACCARGIRVLGSAPAFGPMVAEMALGMALAACREIVIGDAAMRAGTERWLHAGNETTFSLYDQPVGFIGCGGLARSLRPLLAPFRCRVCAYDPWLTDAYIREEGYEPVSLEDLLSRSRFVFVLAVPAPANRALLDRARLERLQQEAVLILISRAHLVDFDALTEMVVAGRFRATIDVFPTEPLPVDHPIRSVPGVVLSAHRAGSVRDGLREIGRAVVDDLEAIVAGLPPRCMQQAVPELIRRR